MLEKWWVTPYCTNVARSSLRYYVERGISACPQFRWTHSTDDGSGGVCIRRRYGKPAAQNIQDSFLNTARKEKINITIYLLSGVNDWRYGRSTSIGSSGDQYQEQLIFKHAISTVAMVSLAWTRERPTAISGLRRPAFVREQQPPHCPAPQQEG